MHKNDAPRKSEAGTQAIDRAFTVLFAFTAERPERQVRELSVELGLNKSTVYRLLQALANAGLVRRDEATGGYRLAAGVVDLAARFLGSLDLRKEARPHIEALVARHGESVNLAVLDGRDAISVDVVPGTRMPQLVSRLGRRIPVYCSGAGKALILDRSDTEVRTLLDAETFAQLTPNTIPSLSAFLERLPEWRAQGWALNDEESETGMRALSAPVYDHTGRIAASVSLSGPAFRIGDDKVAELARSVCETARDISQQLGGQAAGRDHSEPKS